MIQILSDVHLEFYKDGISILDVLTPVAPYLMIAGDLGYPDPIMVNFLSECSDNFEKVFYCPGNHEYYSPYDNSSIDDIDEDLAEICNNFPNIYFLNNSEYHLSSNTVILGTTLWSYIPPEEDVKIMKSLNDYNSIYI